MKILIPFLCAIFIGGCATVEPFTLAPWTYSGNLHKRIAKATRLRLRTGGNTCCGPKTNETTIASITDPEALLDFARRIQFSADQIGDACFCCGGPTLEWYKKDRLLAVVSIQHWLHLRWRGHWPGDARLTNESGLWLAQWCETNGVIGAESSFKKSLKVDQEREKLRANKTLESISDEAASDPF